MGQTRITDAVASAMLTQVSSAFGTNAIIKIYGAGTETTIPATADASFDASAYTVIAEVNLDTTSWGAVTAGENEHYIEAEILSDCTNAAAGDCLFFRGWDSAGTTCIIQGNCGTTDTYDMVMNTVTVAEGATVQITAWTITLPQHEA